MVTCEGGTVPGRELRSSRGGGRVPFLGGGMTGVYFVVSRLVVCFFFCVYVMFQCQNYLETDQRAAVYCPRRENIKQSNKKKESVKFCDFCSKIVLKAVGFHCKS